MSDKSTIVVPEKYEILQKETLYQGVFRLSRYKLRFQKFDGTLSDPVTREILERKSCVAVLPYDPLLDQVVLIEQFRTAPILSHQRPWLLEIVAGIIDPGETTEQVAMREAQEEADCHLLALQRICEFYSSPGSCDELLTLYCGQVDASTACGVHGMAAENEDIRTFALPADEAFKMVQRGEIKTTPAIISLQWLQLNREWLRALWQKK